MFIYIFLLRIMTIAKSVTDHNADYIAKSHKLDPMIELVELQHKPF